MPVKTKEIQRRAMEIYLAGKGTLEQAYKQAELEILGKEIPPEVTRLFRGEIRGH